MGNVKSYKDLIMWQKAKDFVIRLYKATDRFPREETYGLTSQLRRAGVSIPSNIAEGFNRKHSGEKTQFLRIAYGSGAEVETQLIIALELGYLSGVEYAALEAELGEVMKMINTVLNKL
ncbi:MAG: four helix bundle protein [Patescibacteria group bacterium]